MIIFILSDNFDYGDYMPDDAGPRFAEMYGWKSVRLSQCSFVDENIFVVDCYLDGHECEMLRQVIARNPTIKFFFHTVDPWPHIRGTAVFNLLLRNHEYLNVFISSPYLPTESTALLFSKMGDRVVFTPYLYDRRKEIPLSDNVRKKVIIVSGNIGLPDYPVRNSINNSRIFNPLFWCKIKRLPHSGYNFSKPNHAMVGDAYIKELSRYRYAAVCSSRLRLEFLKYREIAYAGCVPIGDLPGTLSDCPSEGIIQWRRNVFVTHCELSNPNWVCKAMIYRDYISRARDMAIWQARVRDKMRRKII